MRKMLLAALLLIPSQLEAASVEITWDHVTKYEDGVDIEEGQTVKYEVWRSTEQAMTNATRLATDLTAPHYTDSSVLPKATYYYFVKVYLVEGFTSEQSNTASVRVWPPYRTKITRISAAK